MNVEDLLVDFYNGAHAVDVVAARQAVLENLASLERAYERLVELRAAGKLGVGAADFSSGNLELVKRISRLIGPGLDSDEVRQAAQEIHVLAERCARALNVDFAPRGHERAEGGVRAAFSQKNAAWTTIR